MMLKFFLFYITLVLLNWGNYQGAYAGNNTTASQEWCVKHCSKLHQKCRALLPEQVESCYKKCWVEPSSHAAVNECKRVADKKIHEIVKHLDHEPAIRMIVAYEGRPQQEVEKKSLALQKWKKVIKKILHLVKQTASSALSVDSLGEHSMINEPKKKGYVASSFSNMEQDEEDSIAVRSSQSRSFQERFPKYGVDFRRDRF